MRDEYQDLLDTGQYTPETIAQWEDRALAWLDRIGDTGKAIDMIEDGMEPAGKVGTMVRRLVMESPEFAELPEERRRAIELRNVLKGTEWGREGVARRLASLTLDSVAKVRAVLDAIRRTPSAIWPISPTSWGSSGWSRSPSGQASLRSAFFPLVTLITLVTLVASSRLASLGVFFCSFFCFALLGEHEIFAEEA